MLSSYFSLEKEEDQQDVARKLNAYMKHSILKNEMFMELIIQNGEPFIENNHEQLMKLYEIAGTKQFLIKRLLSKRAHVQALACRHLGDLRVHDAEMHIYKLINSKDNDVIYHVLLALAKLGDLQRLTHILNANSQNIHLSFRAVIEIIAIFKGPKDELFKATIESSDDYLKGILIKASADYQLEDLGEYYVRYLNSTNINLKIACIRALSELKNPAYEAYVIGMLEDAEWEVRAAAAKGLEKLGTSRSFTALGEKISDSEWWVRHNAANSLVLIPGGKEYANQIMKNKDRFAREAVMGVLALSS
ncbi:HEAT repeat domain-containing protein [Paenibacillus planticolens]|nr:HEAT repeat domain-containing protein [Paenibacillus planticolens]